MTLKLIPIGLLLIFIVHLAPKPDGPCSWVCHDSRCIHGEELAETWLAKLGLAGSLPHETLQATYLVVIKGLHDLPGTYREANHYIYAIAFPALALFLALALGVKWPWIAAATGGSVLFALHPDWYALCTEFCFHVGNWTGLTYVGFNFLLFLILMPGFLLYDGFCVGNKLVSRIYRTGPSSQGAFIR